MVLEALHLNVVTLQKQVLRIITFSDWDAQSSPIFSQLGLIKFMVLVTMQTAVFMFHYYHSMLPKAFVNNYFIFISSTHNFNTKLASKSTYYIDQVRTNYGKFNLQFACASIWNNLDGEIKSLSLRLFKQNLTKQVLMLNASLVFFFKLLLIALN